MHKMTRLLAATVAAATLSFSALSSAAEGDQNQYAHQSDADINLFDMSTWFENAPHGNRVADLNLANPAGWAVMVNPQTHTSWHMIMTNPATWAQFLKPRFYAQFFNPNNWISWVNPESYATFLDPNTYIYWMTPHAYIHALNPDNYAQLIEGGNYGPYLETDTYTQWLNPSAYNILSEPTGVVTEGAGINYIDGLIAFFSTTDEGTELAKR